MSGTFDPPIFGVFTRAPRAAILGDHPNAFSVERNGDVARFLYQEARPGGGLAAFYVCDQVRGMPAVAGSGERMRARKTWGQSNSLIGSAIGFKQNLFLSAAYPRSTFAITEPPFIDAQRHNISGLPNVAWKAVVAAEPVTIGPLRPYLDVANQPAPVTTYNGFALEDMRRQFGLPISAEIRGAIGEGSEPWSSFMPDPKISGNEAFVWATGKSRVGGGPDPLVGGVPFSYQNSLEWTRAGVTVAASVRRELEVATVEVCQGEGGLYTIQTALGMADATKAGYYWSRTGTRTTWVEKTAATISSISRNGSGTVTVTTPATHDVLAGEYVTLDAITGAAGTAFNGPQLVLASPAPTATTFAFAQTGASLTGNNGTVMAARVPPGGIGTPGTNPATPLDDSYYEAEFLRLMNRKMADEAAITGQAIPPFTLVMQTAQSGQSTDTASFIVNAHVDVCRKNPETYSLVGTMRGVVLGGPDIDLNIVRISEVHPAEDGRAQAAGLWARANIEADKRRDALAAGGDYPLFQAPHLDPDATYRTSATTIRVPVQRPAVLAGQPLTIDTDFMGDVAIGGAPPANLGFAFRGVGADAAAAVASVPTIAGDELVVSITAGPTDPASRLQYAVGNSATIGGDGRPLAAGKAIAWSGGRGLLFVPDPADDPLTGLIPRQVRPAKVRHYLPAYSLPVPPSIAQMRADIAAIPTLRWYTQASSLDAGGSPVRVNSWYDTRAGATANTAVLTQTLVARKGEVLAAGWADGWPGTTTAAIRASEADGRGFQAATAAAAYDYTGDWQLGLELLPRAAVGSNSGSAATISAVNHVGGVLTVTTGAAHGFAVDDLVNQAGSTQAAFNRQFRVASVPSTTTYTVALTGSGLTGTGGTAQRIQQSQRWFLGYVGTDLVGIELFERRLGGRDHLTLRHGVVTLDWRVPDSFRYARAEVLIRRIAGVLTLRVNGVDRARTEGVTGSPLSSGQTATLTIGTRINEFGLTAAADWRSVLLDVGNAATPRDRAAQLARSLKRIERAGREQGVF